jgi:hypothetical protein
MVGLVVKLKPVWVGIVSGLVVRVCEFGVGVVLNECGVVWLIGLFSVEGKRVDGAFGVVPYMQWMCLVCLRAVVDGQ